MNITAPTHLIERLLLRLTLLIGLLLVASILILPHYLNPDVAMYSEIGHKLLDGQRPYVDYEEINFPMIHVLNIIPAAMSRLTGWPATISLQLCLGGLLLLSAGLLWRLLNQYHSRLVAVITVFGMILFSWTLFLTFQWGEREHLYTLFYLPWIVLRLMRREDKSVSVGLSLTVGVLAGIGIALKPYFVLTALLVEGFGLLTSRRWYIRTPEVIGVVIIAGLHALYFVFNLDVLQAFLLLIQRLSAGYGAYPSTPWDKLVLSLASTLLISALPIGLALRRYHYRLLPANLMLALAVMGFGSLVGFWLQRKGWPYHTIPFTTTNTLIVLLLIMEAFLGVVITRSVSEARLKWMIQRVGLILILGIVGYEVMGVRQAAIVTQQYRLFDLAPYLQAYTQPNERVIAVNVDIMPEYPVLAALNRRSASRYSVAHPIPIAYWDAEGLPYDDPNHVVPPYAQAYLDALAEDIQAYQPKLIFIQSEECAPDCPVDLADLYAYLNGRGLIDSLILPNYDLLGIDGGFYIYVRKDL